LFLNPSVLRKSPCCIDHLFIFREICRKSI